MKRLAALSVLLAACGSVVRNPFVDPTAACRAAGGTCLIGGAFCDGVRSSESCRPDGPPTPGGSSCCKPCLPAFVAEKGVCVLGTGWDAGLPQYDGGLEPGLDCATFCAASGPCGDAGSTCLDLCTTNRAALPAGCHGAFDQLKACEVCDGGTHPTACAARRCAVAACARADGGHFFCDDHQCLTPSGRLSCD